MKHPDNKNFSYRYPGVSVIIPHWKGTGLLARCLDSLKKSTYPNVEIIVIDNACPDGSIAEAALFSDVRIIKSITNSGYAGGCNLGIMHSINEYIVLLNDDTEVIPEWLEPMIKLMQSDCKIAAVQPKLLCMDEKSKFDYSGAAGGEIDIFGYPFARGRLFDHIELDKNQYNYQTSIFWASGAATLLRREALNKVGFLETDFFAHMEEIDLNWRLLWAGYSVYSCPGSIVYHQSGATLYSNNIKKMILNHRNNLLMILRNTEPVTLCWIFPLRMLLEAITVIYALISMNPKRAAAVMIAFFSLPVYFKTILSGQCKRSFTKAQKEYKIYRFMYRGSVALEYFLRRDKTFLSLKHLKKINPLSEASN